MRSGFVAAVIRYGCLVGLIGPFAFPLTVLLPAAAPAQPRVAPDRIEVAVALAPDGTAIVRYRIRFSVLENDMDALYLEGERVAEFGRAIAALRSTG